MSFSKIPSKLSKSRSYFMMPTQHAGRMFCLFVLFKYSLSEEVKSTLKREDAVVYFLVEHPFLRFLQNYPNQGLTLWYSHKASKMSCLLILSLTRLSILLQTMSQSFNSTSLFDVYFLLYFSDRLRYRWGVQYKVLKSVLTWF